jgi:hypothetical protein
MTRKYDDPEAPEVLEAVIEHLRRMTRDEWVRELAWRPDGVQETWRMRLVPGTGWPEGVSLRPEEVMSDDALPLPAERVAVSGQSGGS